ncbi:MAG: DUF262 domain-containing protein, partial [Nitrososphaerota archaeon]|nr:DUF262 domain-containing protein [Nitrososphaerota archaeon]
MKAGAQDIGHIVSSRDQYIIPRFQRYYEWEPENRERLWNDLCEIAFDSEKGIKHFFGAIVAIPTRHQMGQVTPYLVIDGQQRLTTVSLLLIALRDIAKARNFKDPAGKEVAKKIEGLYLVHEYETSNDHYRLLLRQRDRGCYVQLLEGQSPTEKSKLHEAYIDLHSKADTVIGTGADAPDRLQSLVDATTAQLNVVSVTLEDENPFEIFNSLNSTGLKLAESDLIRNHVFMTIPLEESTQERFEKNFWDPLEATLRYPGADPTTFFRHYLMRNGAYVKEGSTYTAFQAEWGASKEAPEDRVRRIQRLASFYRQVIGVDQIPTGSPLASASMPLAVLRRLGVSTAYPLIMNLAERVESGELTSGDLGQAILAINSFVIRRYVCDESSRGYARWFVAAIPKPNAPAVGSLLQFLGDKGYPSDAQFSEALKTFPLYAGDSSPYARVILESLVRATEPKGERADLSGCDIEHVLPQTVTPGTTEGDAW